MQEEQILCACSAYEQKYYLNPRYASLPSAIGTEVAYPPPNVFLIAFRISVDVADNTVVSLDGIIAITDHSFFQIDFEL